LEGRRGEGNWGRFLLLIKTLTVGRKVIGLGLITYSQDYYFRNLGRLGLA